MMVIKFQIPNPRSQILNGFTLLELVVVIAVIGILATITIAFIDPLGLQKKARDSVRLRDLNTLKSSIVLVLQNGGTFLDKCQPVSPCSSLSMENASDGSGWVGLDLSKYLTVLPRDPMHTSGSFVDASGVSVNSEYQFAQTGGDFEIRAHLESPSNVALYTSDGGNNNGYYEVGTKLDIF